MLRSCIKGIVGCTIMICLVMCSIVGASGQQRLTTLKKRKAQNEKEIAYTNSLLDNTLKSKKVSFNKLLILNQKIKSRESLIQSISSEKALLDKRIVQMQKQMREYEIRLKRLKTLYAKSVIYSYKHRNSHEKLMFLFASKDFNQAYKRYKYLQQYSQFCRKQGRQIGATRDTLKRTVADLKVASVEKEALLARKTHESQQLDREKKQQASLVSQLKKRENKLRRDLQKQKKYAQKLQNEIQRIIKREAQLASRKKKGSGKFALTPEEKLLSDSFDKNKGRLPWPTKTGFISEQFGEHPHPVLKHVKVRNDGVNITTDIHAICRSIFNGVVTHVLAMPGLNTVVIIRHGEFFSVYSNLTDVIIKKGDSVSSRQKIGSVYTNNSDGQTVLKFQLWKGSTKLNPSQWLYRN